MLEFRHGANDNTPCWVVSKIGTRMDNFGTVSGPPRAVMPQEEEDEKEEEEEVYIRIFKWIYPG